MIIDQHDDIQKEYLEKIANIGITIKPKERIDKLPDKDFALIIVKKRPHRKFPICDSASTMLSLLYFLKNKEKLSAVQEEVAGARIKEACVRFDIPVPSALAEAPIGAVEYKIKEAAEVIEKTIPDKEFGLVDGDVRKFPLIDREHTLRAIKSFPKQKHLLDDEQRQQLKENISKAIKRFDIDLHKEKKATVNPYLKRDMGYRVSNLDPEAQKPYIKLAEKVHMGEVMIKEAAAVMERLDDENNLHRTLSPEETLTGDKVETLEKVAFFDTGKEKTASVSAFKAAIQNGAAKKEIYEKLEEHFGEDMVMDLKQDPDTIYESLPEPHQDMIDKIVKENRR